MLRSLLTRLWRGMINKAMPESAPAACDGSLGLQAEVRLLSCLCCVNRWLTRTHSITKWLPILWRRPVPPIT